MVAQITFWPWATETRNTSRRQVAMVPVIFKRLQIYISIQNPENRANTTKNLSKDLHSCSFWMNHLILFQWERICIGSLISWGLLADSILLSATLTVKALCRSRRRRLNYPVQLLTLLPVNNWEREERKKERNWEPWDSYLLRGGYRSNEQAIPLNGY